MSDKQIRKSKRDLALEAFVLKIIQDLKELGEKFPELKVEEDRLQR